MSFAKFYASSLSLFLFACGANSNPAKMFSIQLEDKKKARLSMVKYMTNTNKGKVNAQ